MPETQGGQEIRLDPVQPFDWPGVLAFLRRRVVAGLEWADETAWGRFMSAGPENGRVHGWVVVRSRDSHLVISVAPSLGQHVSPLAASLAAYLDIAFDPKDAAKALGPLMRRRPGLRMPGALNGYEIAVRAILGQQVSLAAATTLVGRFVARFGRCVPGGGAPEAGVRGQAPVLAGFDFPAATTVARAAPEEIATIGIPLRRAQSLSALSRALADGRLSLAADAQPEPFRDQLARLPGIGPWTCEYLAMRVLRDRDAFPASDLVLMRAMGVRTAGEARRVARAWQPWRAQAVVHLWGAAADEASGGLTASIATAAGLTAETHPAQAAAGSPATPTRRRRITRRVQPGRP